MNGLTQMKVGTKLILGFLVVALIGAIIGVLGILKTSELSDLASLMYEREMTGGQQIARANMDMIEATRSVRSAMLAPTEQERARHLSDMQQRLDKSKAGLAASGAFFYTPAGKAELAETIKKAAIRTSGCGFCLGNLCKTPCRGLNAVSGDPLRCLPRQ